jgi:hypothetical protein
MQGESHVIVSMVKTDFDGAWGDDAKEFQKDYKVLWDGDKRQYKSAAAHLSLFTEGDSDSSSSSDSGSDDGDDGSTAAGSDDGDDDVLLAPRPGDVTRTKARG